MFHKSLRLLVVISSLVLLQTSGFSQQFRSARRVYALPANSVDLSPAHAIADFNSDGRPDFLISTFDSATSASASTIMLQKADGSFAPRPAPGLPQGWQAAGDVNGDGKTDIITAVWGPSDEYGRPIGPATVVVSYGNGDGTFRVQPAINLGRTPNLGGLMLRDVNHDGKPDIIAVSSDQNGDGVLETFLNTGRSSFRPGGSYGNLTWGGLLASADFNGDGFADVAVGDDGNTQILLGKGDGSFIPGATYGISGWTAAGDLDGDHRQDLVIATYESARVLLGKGDGTFTTGTALDISLGTTVGRNSAVSSTGIYLGDLNKDGVLDLAVTTWSDTAAVAVYYGKGNGTFTHPKAFNLGGGYYSLYNSPPSFGDFNRDGHIDVLTASESISYSIAYGTGDGGFAAPVMAQAPGAASITTGDFNHDGIEDIAVVEQPVLTGATGTFIRVFLGTARGYFAAPRTYSIPVSPGKILAGDVNRDGHMDLVVVQVRGPSSSQSYTRDALAILLGRGDGSFETPVGYTLLGPPTTSAWIVDINHDGKLDLVADWGAALGKGNGQFNRPIPLPASLGGIVAVAPGDFDASGGVELAVAANDKISLLSCDQAGAFQVRGSLPWNDGLDQLVTADLNGDGLSDILYATSTGTSIVLNVRLSKGQGAFSSTTYSYPSSFRATDIITGDFNRDGKLDVALPGLFSNGADLAVIPGGGDGALSKTPQYYPGSMNKAVVLNINGDEAPDIAGTTTIGVSRLLNTGRK